jgi:hypothetical protein
MGLEISDDGKVPPAARKPFGGASAGERAELDCSSPAASGYVMPTGLVPPWTEPVRFEGMSSGDNVVDGDVRGNVGQHAECTKRAALLLGVSPAGQLNVYLAGDQLWLRQFQRKWQLTFAHDFILSLR